jgi:hypothetical protein
MSGLADSRPLSLNGAEIIRDMEELTPEDALAGLRPSIDLPDADLDPNAPTAEQLAADDALALEALEELSRMAQAPGAGPSTGTPDMTSALGLFGPQGKA